MAIKMRVSPGEHIETAAERAVEAARTKRKTIEFTFNDLKVIVTAKDTAQSVVSRFTADCEARHAAYINSSEYKERQERDRQEYEAKCAAHLAETAKTESEMRDAEVPTPYTPQQLSEYINSLIGREHDYGTCCYAMSMAATAAFNYAAGKLGVTGFQASCADLDFIRRTRSLDGPFIIIKAQDALYPQYNLHNQLSEAMAGWQNWIKERAEGLLAEHPTGEHVHPDVAQHWKRLATTQPLAPGESRES